MVAQHLRLFEVVRAQQHGGGPIPSDGSHQLLNLALRTRIEPGGRLIHQQERGRCQEAAGDGNLLLLATRQLLHWLIERVEGQPQPLQHAFHSGPRPSAATAVEARRVQHVLPRTHLFEERRLDRYAVDVAAHIIGLRHHVVAKYRRRPRVWRHQGGKDADQRRLAAPVRPQDARDSTTVDAHRHLVERQLYLLGFAAAKEATGRLPEALRDAVQLDRHRIQLACLDRHAVNS